VPDRARPFYRVGFYDNIFGAPRMSLYVEVGLARDQAFELPRLRADVLSGLAAESIVRGQRLVAEHSVLMDPAYVHLTSRSLAEARRLKAELARAGVFPIGRYGGWTYCSIEDNILEAKALVDSWSSGEA
jgi:hypothetical protein